MSPKASAETAASAGLLFHVFATAPWPEGSRCVYSSETGWDEAFEEVRRRGVWWELGRRWELPASFDLVETPAWSDAVADVLLALRPLYLRID